MCLGIDFMMLISLAMTVLMSMSGMAGERRILESLGRRTDMLNWGLGLVTRPGMVLVKSWSITRFTTVDSFSDIRSGPHQSRGEGVRLAFGHDFTPPGMETCKSSIPAPLGHVSFHFPINLQRSFIFLSF